MIRITFFEGICEKILKCEYKFNLN